MIVRSRLVAAAFAGSILVVIAGCSGGSTTAPSAAASVAGSPSSVPSPAASTGASFVLPSAIASALASAGAVHDASTLLTADLAASVIGGSPARTTPAMNIPNVSIVSYRASSGDTATLFVEAIPAGVATAELQAAIAMAGAQGQLQAVSGIGDTAGKVVNDHDATVAFIKGSSLVVLAADSGTAAGSDLEPKLEAVAKQVAGQL